jgi:hypothetical protein
VLTITAEFNGCALQWLDNNVARALDDCSVRCIDDVRVTWNVRGRLCVRRSLPTLYRASISSTVGLKTLCKPSRMLCPQLIGVGTCTCSRT